MQKPKTKPNVDKEMNSVLEHIFQNAFGVPLVLNSAPTASSDMKANSWGIFGSDVYIKFGNNTVLKLSGTPI